MRLPSELIRQLTREKKQRLFPTTQTRAEIARIGGLRLASRGPISAFSASAAAGDCDCAAAAARQDPLRRLNERGVLAPH
eukprot:scaffold8946_cov124-Isochrysis_galbana.AAC.1